MNLWNEKIKINDKFIIMRKVHFLISTRLSLRHVKIVKNNKNKNSNSNNCLLINLKIMTKIKLLI